MTKVRIGGNEVTLAEFNGRKALRAAKIVRAISDAWPEITKAMAEFRSEYEAANVLVYDRAEALMRFGPRPLMDPETEELIYADKENGVVAMSAGQLAHLTDEDWEKSGNKLRLPKSPTQIELIAAVFPLAFDRAEEEVLQLLALAIVDKEKLGKAARDGGSGAIDDLLREEAEDLQDKASLQELMALAAAAAEQVETEVKDGLAQVGDRAGKFLRLLGLAPKGPVEAADSETSTSKPKGRSSTRSRERTGGRKSAPSTAPAGGSSSSSSGG